MEKSNLRMLDWIYLEKLPKSGRSHPFIMKCSWIYSTLKFNIQKIQFQERNKTAISLKRYNFRQISHLVIDEWFQQLEPSKPSKRSSAKSLTKTPQTNKRPKSFRIFYSFGWFSTRIVFAVLGFGGEVDVRSSESSESSQRRTDEWDVSCHSFRLNWINAMYFDSLKSA